jgi:hypothetical protein
MKSRVNTPLKITQIRLFEPEKVYQYREGVPLKKELKNT